MLHIYRMHDHRTAVSRNHSYSHGYDEVADLNLWFIVFMAISWRELYAQGGDGSMICIAMMHRLMPGRISQDALLCIVDQEFDLSWCSGVWRYHCRNSSIFFHGANLNIIIYIPGLNRAGDTPCLTITKLSNPSPTVMHALSYLLARTVGSHLAYLESRSKNNTSCYYTNFYKASSVSNVYFTCYYFVT